MDLRRLDLNLLVVFDALFQERSVTVAARRLRISQPAASAALARLRETFGDELFRRVGGRMEPTRAAAAMREAVAEVLSIVEHRIAPPPVFSAGDTHRVFSISTSDIGELCFLPGLLQAFAARAANASLRCVATASGDLRDALVSGAVDVAVGYFPDLEKPEIASRRLFDHPFVLIARTGHPLVSANMSMADFLACRHAVVRQEGRSQEIAERALEQLGVRRTVPLQSPHFVSLPFLLADTDLVSIVPRSLGNVMAGLGALQSVRPPMPLPDVPLAQHWSLRSSGDPAVAWLVSLIDELFLGRDPTLHSIEHKRT